ncbi:MAG: hypothetical protein O2964_18375 [Verrucomicrobia bacterium]|nr:hypothetical protein [Verrucomicrobiota bacterium]
MDRHFASIQLRGIIIGDFLGRCGWVGFMGSHVLLSSQSFAILGLAGGYDDHSGRFVGVESKKNLSPIGIRNRKPVDGAANKW